MLAYAFCKRYRALKDGYLIDVSKEAKEHGIEIPVNMSSALWHSIFKPVRGALNRPQRFRLDDLMPALRSRIEANPSQDSLNVIVPHKLFWLDEYQVQCHLIHSKNNTLPNAAVVHHPRETFVNACEKLSTPLPAFLLLQLQTQLHSLCSLARTSDCDNLKSIRELAHGLIANHPFYEELNHDSHEHYSPDREAKLNEVTDCRRHTLENLYSITDLLIDCSLDANAATILLAMQRHIATLLSPLADLTDLLQTLAWLAAKCPETPDRPIRYNPFNPLLSIHACRLVELAQGKCNVRQVTLEQIELHLIGLTNAVPDKHRDMLEQAKQTFLTIVDNAKQQIVGHLSVPKNTYLQ